MCSVTIFYMRETHPYVFRQDPDCPYQRAGSVLHAAEALPKGGMRAHVCVCVGVKCVCQVCVCVCRSCHGAHVCSSIVYYIDR